MPTTLAELKNKALKDPETRAEYERQRPLYQAATAIIDARSKAKLSQAELAKLMGVKQPWIAEIESGRRSIGVMMLYRVAKATGQKIRLTLEPC